MKTELFRTMQTIRKKDGTFDWSGFTTPENRKAIASLSRGELLAFKNEMEKIDLGMPHSFVREAYAQNPNEDAELLWEALMDEDMNVPLFVVQNPHCPEKLLEAVANGDKEVLPSEVPLDYIREHFPEIIREAVRHRAALESGNVYSPACTEPIYA